MSSLPHTRRRVGENSVERIRRADSVPVTSSVPGHLLQSHIDYRIDANNRRGRRSSLSAPPVTYQVAPSNTAPSPSMFPRGHTPSPSADTSTQNYFAPPSIGGTSTDSYFQSLAASTVPPQLHSLPPTSVGDTSAGPSLAAPIANVPPPGHMVPIAPSPPPGAPSAPPDALAEFMNALRVSAPRSVSRTASVGDPEEYSDEND